ncbi:hypothetical protein BG011_006442 [Mortierella polycephala]|uniref:Uncharacterized protein n=1 Tax=Mortierella polycephala TaxID=41804 RepID=A0A9P6TZK1_9FUNG|nr:hypothetical protein BG011_006442 [Mortierella polycephala]
MLTANGHQGSSVPEQHNHMHNGHGHDNGRSGHGGTKRKIARRGVSTLDLNNAHSTSAQQDHLSNAHVVPQQPNGQTAARQRQHLTSFGPYSRNHQKEHQHNNNNRGLKQEGVDVTVERKNNGRDKGMNGSRGEQVFTGSDSDWHHHKGKVSQRYQQDQGHDRDQPPNGYSVGSSMPSRTNNSSSSQYRQQDPQNNGKPGVVPTLREILDNKALRDEIDESRRSQNSNPDLQDRRPSTTLSGRADRSREQERTTPIMSHHTKQQQQLTSPPQDSRFHNGCTRRSKLDDRYKSMLTEKFSVKLNERVPSSEYIWRDHFRGSPRTGHFPQDRGLPAAKSHSNAHEFNYGGASAAQINRHPSSYSPTEDEEDEEEDQNTVELKGRHVPNGSSTAPQPSPQRLQRLQNKARIPPGTNPSLVKRPHVQSTEAKDDTSDNLGEDSDALSHGLEAVKIAVARTRHELGSSSKQRSRSRDTDKHMSKLATLGYDFAHSNHQHHIPADRSLQSRRSASHSRLEHGRDLALEDLESPTKNSYGQKEQQKQRQVIASQDHLSSHMTIETDNRVSKQVKNLGEGQAVTHVFSAFKGIIHGQEKTIKGQEETIQELEKELKQAQQELERNRKSSQKNERTKAIPAITISSDEVPRHGKDRNAVPRNASKSRSAHGENGGSLSSRGISWQWGAELKIADIQRQLDALKTQKDAPQSNNEEESDSESENEDVHQDQEGEDDETDYNQSSDRIRGRGKSTQYKLRILKQNSQARPRSLSMRRSTTKSSLKSSTRSRLGDSDHRAARYTVEPERGRSKSGARISARSKSTHSEDATRAIEKVEEVVHVHHHVHYEDDNKDIVLSPDPRTNFSSRHSSPRYHSRRASAMEDEYYEDLHRLSPGGTLRLRQSSGASSPPEPFVRGHWDLPLTPSRSRSFPGQTHFTVVDVDGKYVTRPPQLRRHHTAPLDANGHGIDADRPGHAIRIPVPRDEPDYLQRGVPTKQETGWRLRNTVADTNEPTEPLEPALRQKKLAIDMKRFKQLCKVHYPKSCKVCCNGGDDQDHERHHLQYDSTQQPIPSLKIDGNLVAIPATRQVAAPSTTQSRPSTPVAKSEALLSASSGSGSDVDAGDNHTSANKVNSTRFEYPNRQRTWTRASAALSPSPRDHLKDRRSSQGTVDKTKDDDHDDEPSKQELHHAEVGLKDFVRELQKTLSELKALEFHYGTKITEGGANGSLAEQRYREIQEKRKDVENILDMNTKETFRLLQRQEEREQRRVSKAAVVTDTSARSPLSPSESARRFSSKDTGKNKYRTSRRSNESTDAFSSERTSLRDSRNNRQRDRDGNSQEDGDDNSPVDKNEQHQQQDLESDRPDSTQDMTRPPKHYQERQRPSRQNRDKDGLESPQKMDTERQFRQSTGSRSKHRPVGGFRVPKLI